MAVFDNQRAVVRTPSASAAMAQGTVQLDHVIILLPHRDIIHPPQWITRHFQVVPGGRHADGRTENCLILLQDGVYLELIAFVNDDPEKRRGHWWGHRPYGVIDWALTTPEAFDYHALLQRLANSGTGISYAEPQNGGRIKHDGKEVKWEVTFPTGAERGTVPFWCHDLTPRERRVPITDADSHHPCGAVGVAGIQVEVRHHQLENTKKAMAAITQGTPHNDDHFGVGTPHKLYNVRHPAIRLHEMGQRNESNHGVEITVILRTPNRTPPAAIEHPVGAGLVSIRFES